MKDNSGNEIKFEMKDSPNFEMKDNSLQRNKILKDYAEFWNERQFFATK